ncbi:OmpH family outer membrane protein [Pelomonas sp. SE-A7]|uniref:OmpH family outer membrane protein n=1 Tax=Pelomonas sp. SE-A7 TaxID=3054953 RepID=UPI00259CD29A|nr:OmpH family outer membrane protein [Pelomonas sp. SE-A7]MDM4767364.1 OmpH family outer membrane protein [Pelomonas sp. SE-A7]
MKSKLLFAMAVAAVATVTSLSAQAQELKIGYVNTERLTRESNAAKAAEQRLQAEFSKRDKDLKDVETKLRQAEEKLDKEAPSLSENERIKRQRNLSEEGLSLQRKQRELKEDFVRRQNEEMANILDRANRAVKQVFDADKYDLILQDAIMAGPRVDITKKVIDVLNAQK